MSELENFNGAVESADSGKVIGADKQRHVDSIKAAMQATINENGEAYANIRNKRSADITVLKVLGYTDTGSIVETVKAVGKKGEEGYKPHKVEKAPKNVGYLVQNNSAEPIEYIGTECTLVDGVYVANPVKLILAPGGQAPLRKADFVRLMCAPEFSFVAANGKLRSAGAANADGVKELLNSYTFSFEQGAVADYMYQIGQQDGEGKWSVLDEFKSVFGDEENAPVAAGRGQRVKGGQKPTAQDYESNYIFRLLSQNA